MQQMRPLENDQRFTPNCLPLLVGSLPLKNHEEATQLMLQYTPEIPLWIQLPFYKAEGMLYQFVSGMPGVTRADGNVFIDTQAEGFEADFLAFYEAYMAFDETNHVDHRFSLSDETASGFFTFMKIMANASTPPVTVKGQVTGPITMGIGVKDETGKLIFYDERLRDVVIKQVSMNAAWQVTQLASLGAPNPPIIFFDEPGVVGFGSSTYISISREQITDALTECIDAVHRAGGLAGIHICANGDWSLALDSGTDIINFDAFSFFDRLILYRDHLKKFLLDDGILAWGIVPTSNPEWVDAASEERLFILWKEQLEQIKALGIDEKRILSQTLITPSCGTGALSPNHAVKVLSLTKALSERIRRVYF